MQKFQSVWLTVEKERDAAIFEWFIPSNRIFLAKAVYMKLGASHKGISST